MSGFVLVLGTHNAKKKVELQQLLQPHGIRLLNLDDIPRALAVEETGETFAENARLKASVQARHLGQWVLGEDSGLSVEALGGAPGVRSARYAGEGAGDEANNRRLLAELADVPDERRGAYYTCAAAVADPQGRIVLESEGRCRGRIRRAGAGSGGFGYDPLFEIVEYHRTFGELGEAIKGVLSHRGRALRALMPRLVSLAARHAADSPSASPAISSPA